MTEKEHRTALSAVFVSTLLLMTLCGCGKRDAAPVPAEPAANSEAAVPAGPLNHPRQRS